MNTSRYESCTDACRVIVLTPWLFQYALSKVSDMSWTMFTKIKMELDRYPQNPEEQELAQRRLYAILKSAHMLENRYTGEGYGVVNLLMMYSIVSMNHTDMSKVLQMLHDVGSIVPVDTAFKLFDETVLAYAVRHVDAQRLDHVVNAWTCFGGYIDQSLLATAVMCHPHSKEVVEVLWKYKIRGGVRRAVQNASHEVREWFEGQGVYTGRDEVDVYCKRQKV